MGRHFVWHLFPGPSGDMPLYDRLVVVIHTLQSSHKHSQQLAVNNLHQAAEFYPESAEIEFRLAGVHFYLNEESKGAYHLKNGLKFEPDFIMIIEELFPSIYGMGLVQEIIKKHKNPSL